ncbi:MAG: endonuclease MutS2 [Acholeplasmatales bacterium]|nr:endonuclease MutS2 [Acholeplasmatales bacterium]
MYDIKTLEFDKVLEILSTYAKTSYAKKLILETELNNSFDKIIKEKNYTKEAYDSIIKLSDLPIDNLADVNDSLKRVKLQGVLNERELLNIVNLINNSENVIKYFKQLNDIKVDVNTLKTIVDNLSLFKTLKTNITLAINEEGIVVDNASKELFVVRRSLKSLENRLRAKLNELLQTKASMLTEPLIVQRDGRMCLPVKIEYKNSFKGVVHDLSSSNTTAYIEPEVTLETANQIDSYLAEEKKQVQIILKNLSLLVGAEADSLINNLEILTKLDIVYSKALMAKDLGYNDVTLENKEAFEIKKAKHPLIDKEKCVPIDCEIGKKYSVIIITGPNTGGKTVAIKTIGLLHLMVYNGMMVPASSDSKFGFFDDILADIGDEQSIEQSLSTFSSHMTNIVNILNNISFKSLVLLDELGSGTDPKEGSGLAISIIDYLKKAGSRVIATTHYSELKNYAYNNEGIINASVEFNTDTLMPTYRLLLGVPGKSNAIEIAKRLGLNEEIIKMARNELNNISSESSNLIGNLEEEMTKLRKEQEELEKEKKMYANLVYEVNKEKVDLVKRTDKIINDAKNKANDILKEAKQEASGLINEIKNMSEENFKEHQLAELTRKARSLEVKEQEETLFNEELNIGDYVYIKTYEKYGTINKIKGNKYFVNIGQFQMEFKRSELQLSAKPVEKPKKETKLSGYNPASHASLSLDLRGKRYEEVKTLMDDYIDQAIYGNLQQVSIIHGFGTGAIRKAVQEYLKTCPYVKSYRYGGEGEGLNGVTIVYLK